MKRRNVLVPPRQQARSVVRPRRELGDIGIRLFVWLVTLLVLPAGAGLAMLLS